MLRSYLKLVLHFHKQRQFSGSVCVLGNQEIWADYDGLKECFAQMGLAHRTPSEVRPHSSRMFSEDPTLSALAAKFVHASVFFEMMGMNEYVDIDKFALDRPVLQLDLNEPIDPALHDRFDLVIDGGTVEHIFDVRTVLANLVSMTKTGGHVMHIATFQPDHGFYAFSPALFFEFYLANGFTNAECYLMYVDYRRILDTYAGTHPYMSYEYGKTVLPQGSEHPFMVFFVARKTSQVARITAPTQGVFARVASNERASEAAPARPAVSRLERMPKFARGPLSLLRPFVHAGRRLASRFRGAPSAPALPRI